MLSIEPVDRSSMTSTSWPRSSSASARCDPTNPAPPVSRAFIVILAVVSAGSRRPRVRPRCPSAPHAVARRRIAAPASTQRRRAPLDHTGARRGARRLRRRAVRAEHDARRRHERTQVVRQPDDQRRDAEHQPVDGDRGVHRHDAVRGGQQRARGPRSAGAIGDVRRAPANGRRRRSGVSAGCGLMTSRTPGPRAQRGRRAPAACARSR